MTEMHPVQWLYDRGEKLPAEVTRRAYEVYHHLYPGQTLERLNERGGFGAGEIIAFLYARSFPQAEWDQRVNEAFKRK